MNLMRFLLSVLVLVFLASSAALSHESSVPFAAWFMSLHEPDNPISSCCGVEDQRYVDEYYRSSADPEGFVALVEGKWIEVPGYKVNWNDVNPTGRGVIFLSRPEDSYSGKAKVYVYCFVPAIGS